ncbi:unnamed protein product, partial [marine sediment metagenome]
EEERKDFEEKAKSLVEFGKFGLKLFDEQVLANKKYLDLITGDIYFMKSYYMGMVDGNNKADLCRDEYQPLFLSLGRRESKKGFRSGQLL